MKHPLPAKINETVRIYLINMGLSPAYGMHIHGSLFKAYPSGIWQNPPMMVQSWELASGNAAILEAEMALVWQVYISFSWDTRRIRSNGVTLM